MAVLNHEHLFEQAERLVLAPQAGPPRQVDIRRAISAAYYGVFHAVAAAAADQFVGVSLRSTSQYTLVYRSLDHRALKDLCEDLRKTAIPARYATHIPLDGFDEGIIAFATALTELQQKRNSADYDSAYRFRSSDAISAVNAARVAVRRLLGAPPASRRAFLTLLLFPPRR